ncbi:MAG: DivIVA domain-containing protein [candidate division WOR-3 bacterium]
MPLTPLEIKNKTFKRRLKGYDCNEVKTFLLLVSKELEDLRNERASLAQKLDELQAKLATYEKTENLLKETLLTAQKTVTELKDAARKEAENIINKAKLEAAQIKQNIEAELQELKSRVDELQNQRIAIVSQMKAIISNLSMLIEKETKD